MTTPDPQRTAATRGRAERWVTGVTAGVAVTAAVATAGTATVLAVASGASAATSTGSSSGSSTQQGQADGALRGQSGRQSGGGNASPWQQWFGQVNPPSSGGGQGPSAGTSGS